MPEPVSTRRAARPSPSFCTVVGFGCLLAWTYLTFFSRLVHYSTRSGISHLNSTYAWSCAGTLIALVGCAVLYHYLADRKAARETSAPFPYRARRVAMGCAAGALTVCTVVLCLVERWLFTQPWCSIAACTAGISVGVLYLHWGAQFVKSPAAISTVRLSGGFLVGAALFVTVLYFPPLVALVCTALLPLASFALLLPLDRDDVEVETRRTSRASNAAFCRALAAVLIIGFSESLVRTLFLDVDPASNSVAYRWLLLCASALAAALLIAAGLFKNNLGSIATTTRVTLFSLAFLTLLSPVVQGLGLLADLPPLLCYVIFYLLIWVYLAQTAHAYRIATPTLFGLGLGAAYAGYLLGQLVGGTIATLCDLTWRLNGFIALLCACLVLASFLFIADERTFATLVDADDERPVTPRRFRLRVEEVAQAYGLTSKETEVLMLAAKGRTNQRIREELGISTGTVNTHLAHIYKKLDVHDRQQMLDMLDGHEVEGR